MKLLVDSTGLNGKPINPYEKTTAYNYQNFVNEFSYDEFVKIAKISNHEKLQDTLITKNSTLELEGACISKTCSNCAGISCALIHVVNPEWNAWESLYPERFLTTPQQPNSVIEVADETVLRYKAKTKDKVIVWIPIPNKYSKEGVEFYQPIEQPKEKGCTKPNCDCIERAIDANGDNDVKSYPCLHSNAHEAEKLKTGSLSNFEKLFSKKDLSSVQPIPAQSSNIESVEQAAERLAHEFVDPHSESACVEIVAYKAGFNQGQKHQSIQDVNQLFNSFIKSLLDSGSYTITQLREKEPSLIKEVFESWVNELPDYSFLFTN